MKLYMAAGQYVGTQADARKLDKDFAEVEVPTDKPGLMAFLNAMVLPAGDEFETVVERHDPPIGYAEQSVGGDEWFESIAVEHQLTLTQLALENARNEIGRLKSLERGGIARADEVVAQLVETIDVFEALLSGEEVDPFA